MQITRRKALYLFLSSLLGMLLVLMFHRSAFVIFDILGDYYPASTLLNPNYYYVALADFCTMLLAMFIGGWYGIWLGLHWYKMVYENSTAQEKAQILKDLLVYCEQDTLAMVRIWEFLNKL